MPETETKSYYSLDSLKLKHSISNVVGVKGDEHLDTRTRIKSLQKLYVPRSWDKVEPIHRTRGVQVDVEDPAKFANLAFLVESPLLPAALILNDAGFRTLESNASGDYTVDGGIGVPEQMKVGFTLDISDLDLSTPAFQYILDNENGDNNLGIRMEIVYPVEEEQDIPGFSGVTRGLTITMQIDTSRVSPREVAARFTQASYILARKSEGERVILKKDIPRMEHSGSLITVK